VTARVRSAKGASRIALEEGHSTMAEISLANAAPIKNTRISVARTRAPLAARRRTSLAPMPLLAPVTRTTLTWKSLTALPRPRWEATLPC
jgi:hypothetical protein